MVHQQNYTQSTYGYELNVSKSEVLDVLNAFAQAIKSGDLDGIMSFYADEFVVYDMMPPLEFTEREKYRELWKRCFTDYFKFPVQYNFERQSISANDDLAFVNSLIHFVAKEKNGSVMDNWMRSTICLKKFNGTWLITNEHQSVPLDEKTMEGIFEPKPELH